MRDRIVQSSNLSPHPGHIPVQYVYTAGVAWEPFFRKIKDDGRLLAAYCPHCDLMFLPPNLFCERCFEELESPVEVAARGVVHTFTVATVDLDDNPLPVPEVWAFVAIDETDGGLLHRVLTDPEDVYIGMPVEAVFKPAAEREGSILDITGFAPL